MQELPKSLVERVENLDEETLLVADYSSLEIGIQGDFCKRLFGDEQIVKAYDAQLPAKFGGLEIDMHSNNARSVFGEWLGWKIPASVLVADEVTGKKVPVLCKYAGETVDAIPVQEFKKHPFGKICRDLIKAIWYGMAYGKGAYGFSTLLGADGQMIGEELAGRMVGALLDAVPGMRKWFSWVEAFVTKYHGIYSLGGRWCDLAAEMLSGEDWMFRRAFRRAYNFPCQATGAEIIGWAMVTLLRDEEFRGLGYRLVLQVHDELVCRGPKKHLERASQILVEHMSNATANGVPLLFKPQVSWGYGADYFAAK